jgi:VWFA-related protein
VPSAFSSSVAVVLTGVLAAGAEKLHAVDDAAQPRQRTVYVSVTDKDGSPVTDVTAGEFEVKEGGRKTEIVSAKLSSTPLRIALIDADAGTGAFQLSILRFIQKLVGHAEFSLTSVLIQAEKVMDYTADVDELRAGISRVGIRGRERNNPQLIEAIAEVTKDNAHEARRPAIVVMRIGGEAASSVAGTEVKEALRKSGAVLYVVSTLSATTRPASQVQGDDIVSVARGKLADDEVESSALNLALVLGDGAKESGGRHEIVVSTTLVTVMEQIADELLNQYQIDYALPADAKLSDKLSVSVKRKGVILHAPSRIPN